MGLGGSCGGKMETTVLEQQYKKRFFLKSYKFPPANSGIILRDFNCGMNSCQDQVGQASFDTTLTVTGMYTYILGRPFKNPS